VAASPEKPLPRMTARYGGIAGVVGALCACTANNIACRGGVVGDPWEMITPLFTHGHMTSYDLLALSLCDGR
jgi:hypothetical protein